MSSSNVFKTNTDTKTKAHESLESDKFILKDKKFDSTNFVPSSDVDNNETQCGFSSFRPASLQWFASPSIFTAVYCISMMFLGMPNAYFYAINTTIEKVFNMNSKVTGVILIGNDVSQVLFSLVIGYVGSKGSRPLWMAIGLFTCSASCFIYASNHYFWDGTNPDSKQTNKTDSSTDLCWAKNSSMRKSDPNECPVEEPINYLPASLFFIGQFAAGIGNTALISLGVSYNDDYAKKKNAPMLFAFMIISRMLGAFMGFVVAGICLRIYVIPGANTQLTMKDPRWLGAWWLGFVGFGCCLAVCSTLMFLMPKKLPKKVYKSVSISDLKTPPALLDEDEKNEEDISKMAVKDMIQTIWRLLKNPVLMLSLLSESVLLLYVGASQIYSSRYTEVQFRQSASKASILTGVFSVCIMMVSCMAGSVAFSKWRPNASRISGINCTLRFCQVLLIIGQMMLSCGKVNYANVSIENSRFKVESSCSNACECSSTFQPVCIGNTTFLSPCIAGCTNYQVNDTKTFYNNCTCGSPTMLNDKSETNIPYKFSDAIPGICASETCSALIYYLALASTINMLTSALFPATATIILRSVNKADKSMAMALKTVGFCLIGFFPGPVMYGAVFDSACILRESERCTGDKGNCWVYDIDLLRRRFLGTSATVVTVSAILSFFLYLQVRKRKIVLFDDETDVEKADKNDKVESELKTMS